MISFSDDDFVLSDDYLLRVIKAFGQILIGRSSWDTLLVNRARGVGLDWETGLAALRSATVDTSHPEVADHIGAYGCNMSPG